MSAATEVAYERLADFPLPSLSGVADKDARGRVLVVGGSAFVPGACLLTGLAALRAGAGKLQLAVIAPHALAIGMALPEAAVIGLAATPAGEIDPAAAADLGSAVGRSDAVVVGPGMMDEASAGALSAALMAAGEGAAFVLDAAAMTGLDLETLTHAGVAGRLVLTPHAGEMARLTGRARSAVEDDPLDAARAVAKAVRGVVIMKGAESFIVSPDGRAWRHGGGVVGLATSGSGDVLAGVIGGLLARGASPLVASVWGVCLHGAAGRRLSARMGPVGFIARDVIKEIPSLLAEAGGADGG